MSSSPNDAPGGSDRPSGDRRQSLTKFMTRAKSALKRDKPKRTSASGDAVTDPSSISSTPANSPPVVTPSDVSELKEGDPTTRERETKKPDAKPAVEEKKKVVSEATSRAVEQQEKARALFEKYGLTLEPHEWPMPSTTEPAERVQKAIRMRVHRQCHRCQNTFGADKVCAQCTHKRCKKCPRYPVKKPKHAQDHGKAAGVTAASTALVGAAAAGTAAGARTERAKDTPQYRYVIPAKTQLQDRVRKEIKQRVHRKCHKCQTEFIPHVKTCGNCNHIRCTKCPREPAKLDKYPNGYPGDAQPDDEELATPAVKDRSFKKVRRVVKWHCHSCDQIFIQGSKVCGSCDHKRCDDCRRVPPKKEKPAPDPDIVKSVEAKLAALSLPDDDKGNQKTAVTPRHGHGTLSTVAEHPQPAAAVTASQ